jgi:Condensation domain
MPRVDLFDDQGGHVSIEAPLSFGQLYSWREIDSYPDAYKHEANLPACWDLRGLRLDDVQRALRQLFDWYEPLRTSYHRRDGLLVQRVHAGALPPISHEDRRITDFSEPDRVTGELVARPFPMTDELCWRGLLVTTDGRPMYLAMAYSHLIVDVWSIHELERQFRAILTDPDTALLNYQLGASQQELAQRHRRDAGAQARQEGAERYWRKVLTDELAYQPPTPPAGVVAPRIQATLHSHRLTTLVAEAAGQLGVTAPAVVAALVAAGIARHTGARRIPLSLMSSNRFSPETQHSVGTLNQLIPVLTTVDPASPLAAHITAQHWAAAKAYRHSCYDVDRIGALAVELGLAGAFPQLFPCWFNYLQFDTESGGRRADRTPAELVWTPQARPFGQPVDVRVTVQGGRTSVALRTDPAIVDADALAGILRTVALGALRAVTEPQRPVGELIGGELPPSLFPALPVSVLA